MRLPSINSWSPGLRRAFFIAAALVAGGSAPAKPPAPLPDPFTPYIELAPFKVNGKQLAISILARSGGDRRYAEAFAGEVIKVVGEAVTSDTGKGLVIIGRKGEPHPVLVFRKFLALAKAGQLDPGVAARAPEVEAMLDWWANAVNGEHLHERSRGAVSGDDGEFEKISTALPLPLEGVGAKLYQLAWREDFADARVEAALRALRPADFEGNLFAHFDWVFYLPPRNAFDQVLDTMVDDALKEDHTGFMGRLMAKGVMLLVKSRLRKTIEGVRQGLLFMTVLHARTPYDRAAVFELTGAYLDVYMPDDDERKKDDTGSEHDRAVRAVRAKRSALDAEAKKLPEAAPAN